MWPDADLTSWLSSLPGDIWSHPGRPLAEHLEGTAALAEALRLRQGGEVEARSLRRLCLVHDLGKIHRHFQAYLRGTGKGIPHAEPSTWFLLTLLLEGNEKDVSSLEAIR